MTDNMDTGTGANDVVWIQDGSSVNSGLDVVGPSAGSDDTLTIGTLAREFNVTLRAIRFYESKGLLKPQRDGKTRIYSPQDRDRLALILKGKHLGFTLSEIRALIAAKIGNAVNDNEAGPLGLSPEQCSRQIDALERQKREIEDAIAELRGVVAAAETHSSSPRMATSA
jgi:DNA-binding transcriptional MerR regulator